MVFGLLPSLATTYGYATIIPSIGGLPGHASTSTAKPDIHSSELILCMWWYKLGVAYYELLRQNGTITASMTTLSLNPHDRELFLVGTETGLIHRGSFDDKVCSATYEDHKDKVTFIQWNFLHPRVFLSCSNDYTLQIWDHKER
ncbi:dynein intermediate chain 1, axonemal [Caerostris darwini]|uniref:Dynein intermediate chain 1, axonemal n=1 Tax=Caerostris darwini TaxID=1538125 RepID=A0AAV4SST2_9ARAC|nr:dynein intermediate chain 1, axonemal [Caerostris darwini]